MEGWAGTGESRMALAYLAYVAGVLVLPGTVLWRRLAGRSGWLLVDAFLCTAVVGGRRDLDRGRGRADVVRRHRLARCRRGRAGTAAADDRRTVPAGAGRG